MRDTIAIALIAVGGTLGSGALSYLASRSNTKAQLEGVRVEILKLQKSQHEEARQEKVTVYFEYLVAAENLERFYRGLLNSVTPETYKEAFNGYTRMHNRLVLIGDEDVVDSAEQLRNVMKDLAGLIVEIGKEHPDKASAERYEMAISQKSSDWHTAVRELQDVMRKGTERS
jgi:hypothetical protein